MQIESYGKRARRRHSSLLRLQTADAVHISSNSLALHPQRTLPDHHDTLRGHHLYHNDGACPGYPWPRLVQRVFRHALRQFQVRTQASNSLDSGANVFDRVWRDTLVFPAYAAALSIFALLVHLILLSRPVKSLAMRLFTSNDTPEEEHPTRVSVVGKSHVEQLGGPVIFGFLVARLVSCLTLLGLSVVTSVRLHDGPGSHLDTLDWLQIAICGVYVSATLTLNASL